METLRGIVLSTIKYNERHNITRIYTDERGMLSFLVQQGKTPAARMRMAMMMPLSLVQFEARPVSGSDLFRLHDVQRRHPLGRIYAEPVKNAIALMMCELLTHCIHEQERNAALFNYIDSAVKRLEQLDEGVANFHICFIFHLGVFLGIEPRLDTYAEGRWFNMTDGVFVASPSLSAQCLPPEKARVIVLLSRMRFSNLHLFRFTRQQRNEILDIILSYFRIHHSAIGALRSPAILSQLFC